MKSEAEILAKRDSIKEKIKLVEYELEHQPVFSSFAEYCRKELKEAQAIADALSWVLNS
jgi:hypothetical protein